MAYNRFRLSIIIRVFFLSFSFVLLSYFLMQTEFIMLSVFLTALIVYQTYSLFKYVELMNRDLKRFLDSIEFSDFSQSFSNINLGPTFIELKKSFDQVTQKFIKIRAEKEERFLYFQTVVEHVGIGLISYKPDGEIEFINKTALSLLNIESIRNINSLDKLSKSLTEILLKIKSGEQTLFKLNSASQTLHLAINATRFKLKQQFYTLVSIQNIQSEVERERIARELEIGQEVQKKLLPSLNIDIPGFDLAGFCLPAKEIGGDYYDIINGLDNKLGIIIGDVSGKGLPAAIYMTLTKGILQACVSDNLSPAEALSKANQLIYQIIERGFFVSVFFALLDYNSKKVVFSRAGHNPLIHYNKNTNEINTFQPGGIALGLEKGSHFRSEIEEAELQLNSGDILVFYTDGFSEAMNDQQEEFGEDRLLDIIKKHNEESAPSIIDRIHEQVMDFTGDTPRHDDMTMMILKAD